MKIDIDGERNTITVDGVVISLELLKSLANPDPTALYSMERDGDVVSISHFYPGTLNAPRHIIQSRTRMTIEKLNS